MFNATMIGAVLTAVIAGSSPVLELPGQVSPPSSAITVEVVTVNGSGCPAGTAAVAPSEDNTAFTVTYSNYIAQVGLGASPIDFRKNCQLNLKINVPSGFTYAIAQADYRGYAYLEKGAYALEKASYYFQGSSVTTGISHWFNGPYDDNWQTTDTTDVASLVWAPCGEVRNLNVNTELRVYGGASDTSSTTSLMMMDSTDGSVSTVYHLAWAQCS